VESSTEVMGTVRMIDEMTQALRARENKGKDMGH
jgi:hypothetical protein